MNRIAKIKNNFIRISAISVLIIALVLVLFSCVFSGENTAFSVSPDGYNEQVVDENNDWYMGENYLNLARLKEIVENWKCNDNYSFDDIDPIVVAVIDSGINSQHEIFTGKYDENGVAINTDGIGKYDVLYRDIGGNEVKRSVNSGVVGYDNSDTSADKHGTHVAGIIATFIHELDLEKYIKILPIKASYLGVDGKTYFRSTDLSKAVDIAVNKFGAKVVNMSLSSAEDNTAYDIVTEELATQATFIAAAGNHTGTNSGNCYPAAGDYCIGVMNYNNSNGGMAIDSTSNYGSRYDICAPGSAYYSANGSTNDSYKALKGTSMASPVVAFGASLFALKYRAFAKANAGFEKTATEIAKAVKNSVKDSKISKDNKYYDVFDMCKLVEDEPMVKIALAEDSQGGFSQKINSLKPVKLQLESNSSLINIQDGKGAWYLINEDGTRGDKIGEGLICEFMPKKTGRTYITAVFAANYEGEFLSNETAMRVAIDVAYVELSADDIKNTVLTAIDSDGNVVSNSDIRTGVQYEFLLSGVDTDALPEDTKIYWFVNGELAGEGKTFKYTFRKDEKTSVTARINGLYTKVCDIEFAEEISEQRALESLEIFTIVVGACITIAIIVTLIVLVVKTKKSD